MSKSFAPTEVRPVRRVVTGHDEGGRSIVVIDGASPHMTPFMGIPGFAVIDLWRNGSVPVDNSPDGTRDSCTLPLEISPPPGGAVFRTTQFPPESTWRTGSAADAGETHPHMHATHTLDYAIVLSGEISLVLDDSEVALRAGDVVIQRGTRHAWANRSDQACVVAFVMADALPVNALATDLLKSPGRGQI